jgi:hypothetical protein
MEGIPTYRRRSTEATRGRGEARTGVQTTTTSVPTWTNGTYGYSEEKDSSTSGLFYVESNDLLKGRQWTIGSSLMLVGMLIGFGGAVVVMRHKNKKTSKARPLMDDPKSDIA